MLLEYGSQFADRIWQSDVCQSANRIWQSVCLVFGLTSQLTAMVMLRQSVDQTFPVLGQSGEPVLRAPTFVCN